MNLKRVLVDITPDPNTSASRISWMVVVYRYAEQHYPIPTEVKTLVVRQGLNNHEAQALLVYLERRFSQPKGIEMS